ncbi:TRAF3-interacting protein 1 isoform X2 [Zeugodacus cucurbitae]|uniref:TRAF3-interacting protein 1 isoform X2 n=1 Tax=Zeugodacus cucurbitae TaxID=28588 RepID=UPI0023D95584|nr:TRAF3-interacting protein 1 isoform X2 [Zeugodacus cucurbitae]
MSELDVSVIKLTQQTLGKYVKKPPLTEKLLTKPPFRFLHDVFNAVIKETGCFVGLYTAEELNSDNIKDRDDKMRFLQKMIDVIKFTTKKSLTVRTSKIVAGQEPEKTNELLQLMGEVIEKKLDWKIAVEEVLNGKAAPKTTSSTKSKPQVKPVEQKIKDKTNEKSKDKEVKPKETKAKDVKKVTKNISLSTKTEKPAKRTTEPLPKSTENRDKSKSSKVMKEVPKDKRHKNGKDVEKSTISKHKTETKAKSPSPIKNKASVENESDNLKSNEPTDEQKHDSIGFGPIVDRGSTQPNQMATNENQRRDSKVYEPDKMTSKNSFESNSTMGMGSVIMDTPIDIGSSNLILDINTETMNGSNVESRKSSAGPKRTSGKSRRSSAKLTTREDHKASLTESKNDKNNDNGILEADILKKALDEAFQANARKKQEDEPVQKSVTQSQTTKTIQKQSPTQTPTVTPTPPQPLPTEVRRESTFTRENSRDSSTNNTTNRPRTSLRPPSARPASARPGAPRRRDRNIEIVLQPNDQVKLSGINVKLEAFGDLDDDGENLVVIEDANTVNIAEAAADVPRVADTDLGNNLEQQGHLVQQILETQKEFMQQQNVNSSMGKNEKDMELANNSAVRQSSARQMNSLRDIIQNLTKSVNPFGKLMDFIPEDIDAMQLELTMWRDTYTQVANELRREKSLTESATEPMKEQLVQIEANIKEFMEMIDASRTKILQNSEKILKMLGEQ